MHGVRVKKSEYDFAVVFPSLEPVSSDLIY